MSSKDPAEKVVRDIRRQTRRKHSTEEKIRIVLEGLRGEYSIAELCRREGIAESLYYSWSKEFLEAGKKRLAGDVARQATSAEVKDLKREMHEMSKPPASTAFPAHMISTSLSRSLGLMGVGSVHKADYGHKFDWSAA